VKKLINCVITLFFAGMILMLSSCGNEAAPEEETDFTEDVITEETRELGENIHYSSQCVSGDLFIGIEYVYGQGLDGQNIVSFNLNTGEKEHLLEFDTLSYRVDPPAIEGNLLVWSQADISGQQLDAIDWDTLNYDIFVYYIETGNTRQVTDDEYVQRGAVISGKWVMWLDDRNDPGERYPYPASLDIYAYNLDTGEENRITTERTAEGYGNLAISGDLVVWSDNRYGDPEVKSRPGNVADYNNEIYTYDLGTGKERRITNYEGNDHYPTVHGNRIAWLRQIELRKADIMVYDLESGKKTRVSSSGYADYNPSVFEKRVVWMDAGISKGNTNNDVIENGVPGGADIYGYDFTSGEESLIIPSEIERESGNRTLRRVLIFPVISEDYLVYTWGRQIGPIVYMKKLE
jgi:Tol biopolymer transport system component